jgi:hypothetical protein
LSVLVICSIFQKRPDRLKKISAILLIAILLFNWVGYRAFTSFLETRSSNELVAAFDNQHTEDMELISVKVASSLPYYTGTGEFEKAVGEIEINEIQYNYVQRKVTHDSIEYICVVNKEKTAIKKATDQYYKLVNDVEQNPTKKGTSAKIKLLNLDYCQADNSEFASSSEIVAVLHFNLQNISVNSYSIAPPDLPPNSSI